MRRRILLVLATATLTGAGHHHELSDLDTSLKEFLATYLQTQTGTDQAPEYSLAFVDLNEDRSMEALVHLRSRDWCGSGGCTTLILVQKGNSWAVNSVITITRPPIRVLHRVSRGWHSIAVSVAGGGTIPGYEAELEYDGRSYPTNPSVPPARKLRSRPPGEAVIR